MLEMTGNGAGSREARRAVGELSEAAAGRAVPAGVSDPELVERPQRRRFSAEYKLRILREADGCERPGEVGALLRREGLYTSHLTYWRKQRDAGAMSEQTVDELTPIVGTRPACRAVGASVASVYRRRRPSEPRPRRPRQAPTRALSESEREAVLELLHSERFVDCAPAQVYATLLDEGRYLASERTMYRLLEACHGSVRERRDQLTHPAYVRPELLAERPNELWSWDVSKLKGPAKWAYFYL